MSAYNLLNQYNFIISLQAETFSTGDLEDSEESEHGEESEDGEENEDGKESEDGEEDGDVEEFTYPKNMTLAAVSLWETHLMQQEYVVHFGHVLCLYIILFCIIICCR